MDDLLTRIINCSTDEIDDIIRHRLDTLNKDSEIKILGFNDNNFIHKGFINQKSKIRYGNYTMNSYSMNTTDYFYEFARFIRDKKITSRGLLVKNIETFINNYFGINKDNFDHRDDYFDSIAFMTTSTDEEYFKKLEELNINDLKNKNIAMCTEKAAIAQNLLSFFNFDTYYCMGSINIDGNEEAHCFNIVKTKNNYKLIDYSMPTYINFSNNKIFEYVPFWGIIEMDHIEDVITNSEIIEFNNYRYLITEDGVKKIITSDIRKYVVGKFEIEKNLKK